MSSNPSINLALGCKVKDLRTRKKITREKLAEELDISSRFLADVEAGKVGVSLETLIKLCIALGTTSDYLLGIIQIEQSAYQELETRIKQIPAKYIPQLTQMVTIILGIAKDSSGN